MNLREKLDILHQLYDIYDAFSSELPVACVRGCAVCCTQNVTMTTLEGYRIIQHLTDPRQRGLLERLPEGGAERRFQPAISTNELAAFCFRGEEPPQEATDSPQEPCPFLSDSECLIYPERPFGCRCFISTQKCEAKGFARVDPFVISVNTLFLQFLEHVDAGGLFGNLTDILRRLSSEEERKRYETDGSFPEAGQTPVNHPIPGLLVPPAHQQRMRPILDKIGPLVFGGKGRREGDG
jgi:hypothetical protein